MIVSWRTVLHLTNVKEWQRKVLEFFGYHFYGTNSEGEEIWDKRRI